MIHGEEKVLELCKLLNNTTFKTEKGTIVTFKCKEENLVNPVRGYICLSAKMKGALAITYKEEVLYLRLNNNNNLFNVTIEEGASAKYTLHPEDWSFSGKDAHAVVVNLKGSITFKD